MTVAMLIIDMQVGFIGDEKRKDDVRVASEYINYSANLLRRSGHIVVHVQDEDVEGGRESSNYEIVPSIERASGDLYVNKKWSNSFWNTELESMLKERGVRYVIVSGFAAEHCVLFTYNGASERGFSPAVLQRGVIGEREGSAETLQRDRAVISHNVIGWLTEKR
ncbi:isochorismatase family protein [Paenibacillus antri]|uniref:Isochorismatase family protein n=1 Tax=Paenibacillus antri TaxID=2582848 RepID=A0A5R9GDX6_9BACL|nr:isochorismatase family protein [Paenibacillus antri]TLS52310.1 isochorismatase family protein [Paenibacillus antri]